MRPIGGARATSTTGAKARWTRTACASLAATACAHSVRSASHVVPIATGTGTREDRVRNAWIKSKPTMVRMPSRLSSTGSLWRRFAVAASCTIGRAPLRFAIAHTSPCSAAKALRRRSACRLLSGAKALGERTRPRFDGRLGHMSFRTLGGAGQLRVCFRFIAAFGERIQSRTSSGSMALIPPRMTSSAASNRSSHGSMT